MVVTTDDANDDTYTPLATTYVEVGSIAEFNALEVGTLAKLALNNAQVNGVDWSAAYVEDATGAVEFDGLNLDLLRGDILNGYIYVKRGQFYYDDDPSDDVPGRERPQATNDVLTSADTYTMTRGNELQPTEFTMPELLNDANFSKLISLRNVSITKNGRFYVAEADGEQVRVNDMLGYLPLDFVMPENGEKCDITGIFSWNGLAYQIYLTSVKINTAITSLEVVPIVKESPVYNLMGREMRGTLPAGIYIQNGRKFIVR